MLDHIDLSNDYLFINHLNFIYTFYICITPEIEHLNIEHLKAIIDKTKRMEEKISKHELRKRSKYLKKLHLFSSNLV